MALGVVFLTFANLFLVAIPVLIRDAIDAVQIIVTQSPTQFSSAFDALFDSTVGVDLALNAFLLIGAVILYGILLFLTRQTLIVTSRKIEYEIRDEIYHHLQKLPLEYFSTNKSGDIYVRTTEDVSRVREYFGPAFMYTINTLTRAGIIITIMFMVSRELTLWALIPLPFLSVVAYWISGYINRMSQEIQEQYSEVAGRAQEAFSSIRLIKAYVREAFESERFYQESEIYKKKKLKLSAIEALFFPLLTLMVGISVILVVWKGGVMVSEGLITVGNIAEFIIYVAYLTWPVAALGYTLNIIQRSAASNKRIQEFLAEPIKIADSTFTDINIDDLDGDIVFENVSFKYPKASEYAIKDVSFRIKRGSKVGIVGRTGSGKSTLVNLLPRLYDATVGKITIGSVDIKHIPLSLLRSKIGFVPQESFLFSDTIGENIAFGVLNATEEDIIEAAKKAQILDNILEFDKKFQTILGERGITLSGGQKQRTSIARALIKKPDIIVFDDSLSAVDTKTEELILTYLYKDLEGATSLMISHRISTIQMCDEIIVMEDGKLAEYGTHDELMANNFVYARMYKKQLLEHELDNI